MNRKSVDLSYLVEYAARPIDDMIREVTERHIREDLCEKSTCDRFEECDVAQHDVEMLRRHAWRDYARLN